jgi:Phytanoyl-CoA dioxygenase (PhyH)
VRKQVVKKQRKVAPARTRAQPPPEPAPPLVAPPPALGVRTWSDVLFPYDPAIPVGEPVTPADVRNRDDLGGTAIRETYACDGDGVPGLHRRGTLRHWMTDLGWRCLDDAPDAVPVPVRAGGVVVFSSLTPHRTGPNRTDAVRKAYIVQFAPDGAHTVTLGDDGTRRVVPCDHPDRQFLILRNGSPVIAPAAG